MSESVPPAIPSEPAAAMPSVTPQVAARVPRSPAAPGLGLQGTRGLDFVLDVPVELSVEIGRRTMKLGEILALGPGAVLELDKINGEPLDLYANDRLVARGEAVVVGERYGIRLKEVLVTEEHE